MISARNYRAIDPLEISSNAGIDFQQIPSVIRPVRHRAQRARHLFVHRISTGPRRRPCGASRTRQYLFSRVCYPLTKMLSLFRYPRVPRQRQCDKTSGVALASWLPPETRGQVIGRQCA